MSTPNAAQAPLLDQSTVTPTAKQATPADFQAYNPNAIAIGGDRALTQSGNWASYSAQQLYDAVHTNNDPAQAYATADNWHQLGSAMNDHSSVLQSQATGTESGWQGKTADIARSAITQLASWGQQAGNTSIAMGQQVQNQASVVAEAQRAMPEPVVVNPQQIMAQAFASNGITGLVAGLQDVKAKVDQANAAHAQAVDVMNTMESASKRVDAGLPAFIPPPTKAGTGPGVQANQPTGTATPRQPGMVAPGSGQPGATGVVPGTTTTSSAGSPAMTPATPLSPFGSQSAGTGNGTGNLAAQANPISAMPNVGAGGGMGPTSTSTASYAGPGGVGNGSGGSGGSQSSSVAAARNAFAAQAQQAQQQQQAAAAQAQQALARLNNGSGGNIPGSSGTTTASSFASPSGSGGGAGGLGGGALSGLSGLSGGSGGSGGGSSSGAAAQAAFAAQAQQAQQQQQAAAAQAQQALAGLNNGSGGNIPGYSGGMSGTTPGAAGNIRSGNYTPPGSSANLASETANASRMSSQAQAQAQQELNALRNGTGGSMAAYGGGAGAGKFPNYSGTLGSAGTGLGGAGGAGVKSMFGGAGGGAGAGLPGGSGVGASGARTGGPVSGAIEEGRMGGVSSGGGLGAGGAAAAGGAQGAGGGMMGGGGGMRPKEDKERKSAAYLQGSADMFVVPESGDLPPSVIGQLPQKPQAPTPPTPPRRDA